MAWTIELSRPVAKSLEKLGAPAARRIAKGLREIAELENPRLRGIPMVGNHAGHWRYRFGDHRVIARIEDQRLIIIVLAIGYRREVYD